MGSESRRLEESQYKRSKVSSYSRLPRPNLGLTDLNLNKSRANSKTARTPKHGGSSHRMDSDRDKYSDN